MILNDNGMSIDPNVGGLSRHLSRLRSTPEYYEFKRRYRQMLTGSQTGKRVYAMSHDVKTALKNPCCPAARCLKTWALPIWVPWTATMWRP